MTTEPLTDAERDERISTLRRELATSAGVKARGRWDSLRRSLAVFTMNGNDLMQALRLAETQPGVALELIQNVRESNTRELFFNLLDTRLHNMLASAVSLVDHTRRIFKPYEDSDFLAEFTRRNDGVRTAPGSAFLRDLRNYLLHVGVLNFTHNVSMNMQKNESFTSEIRLDVPILLAWSKWSASARSYLEDSGSFVHLSETVQSYVAAMHELYFWTMSQFESLHGEDIDASNRLVAELNLAMTNGVSDGRDWFDRIAHLQENVRAFKDGREQTVYVPRAGQPTAAPDDGSTD